MSVLFGDAPKCSLVVYASEFQTTTLRCEVDLMLQLCFSAARAGLLGRPNVNAWRLRPDLICVRAPVLLTTGLHRQFATKAQAVNLKKGDLVIRKGI